MDKRKYFYIYNIEQADFFVKNGATALGVGKGSAKGDIFIKFARSKREEEIFSRWVDICNKVNDR